MGTVLDTQPRGLMGTVSGRATVPYRLAVGILRFLARWVFAIRVELRGEEHLPRDGAGQPVGGWIAAPIPHVSWADPLFLVLALPLEPRPVFLAAGDAVFRTAFRRALLRLIGGVVPVWPRGGALAFSAHVDAARQVVTAGAVFGIFPEFPRHHPPPNEPRRIEAGIGYIALRTGAPVVPIVLGGTHELHRGRRLVVQVLSAQTAAELAGLPAGLTPRSTSSAEREAAHRIASAYGDLTQPLVLGLYHEAEAFHASVRRTWPWLTHLVDR